MSNKINKGTGAGGQNTNINGIKFEENIYLYDWIIKKGYKLSKVGKSTPRTELYEILKDNRLVGWYGRQGKIYDALKIMFEDHINNKHIKSVLSKKINPDAFILSKENNKLTIFEKKWQQRAGSVDEKIQTAPFKLEMFNKLLRGLKIEISYQYILSKWFKQDSYRNVKEYYMHNNKINIWTYNENLDKLNIDDYI